MYCASDFHVSMLVVILHPCLISVISVSQNIIVFWFNLHKTQMLPEMVFAIERACFEAFLDACVVAMASEMLLARLQSVTVDAFTFTSSLVGYDLAKRCTNPFLKGKMEALLVT